MAIHNVTLRKQTPAGYRPETRIAQGMNLIADAPADPKGKVFVMYKGLDTYEFLIDKGVTHFTNYDFAGATSEQLTQYQDEEGRAYDQAPQTKQQFSLSGIENGVLQRPADKPDVFPWNFFPWVWDKGLFGTGPDALMPMTPEQGFAAGLLYSTSRSIVIFENHENLHAVGDQWEFRETYYDAFIPRMEAEWNPKGIQWYVADNYYSNGGKTLHFFGSAAEAKAYASKPVEEWDYSELLFGRTRKTNTWCYGVYLGPLDLNVRIGNDIVYNAFLAHKAGKFLFVFMQGVLEWRPNNFEKIEQPDGTLYKKGKLPHTPTQAFSYVFLGLEHADGFIPFGLDNRIEPPFQFLKFYHEPGALYYPTGSTVPVDNNLYPHWIYEGDGQSEKFPTAGVGDNAWFARDAWFSTFWHVQGGDEWYCRLQIDGGAWIETSNVDMDDVADSQFGKRGRVYSKKLGNLLAFYYYNPYADIELHTVKFEHPEVPGITFQFQVHGSAVRPGLIDLSTIVLT